MKRYVLFYQNYTGAPFHWSFDHVWSLCVEEHFYIMLPILFLIVQRLFPARLQTNFLFLFVLLTIGAGIAFKFLSFYFTNSKDTFSGTHNRIDALAWGVLLNLLLSYFGEKWRQSKLRIPAFLVGLALLAAAIYLHDAYDHIIFEKIFFHSIIPIAFFLMLAGLYYTDFSAWKPLRVIAYYSYNWYLWHPIYVIVFTVWLGNTVTGLLAFMATSFATAVLFTVLVEEPFLARRKAILGRIFRKG